MKNLTITGRIVRLAPIKQGSNSTAMVYVETTTREVFEYMVDSRRIKLVGGRWFSFTIGTAHDYLDEAVCLFDANDNPYYVRPQRVVQYCNIEPSILAISDLDIKELLHAREQSDHQNKFSGQDCI